MLLKLDESKGAKVDTAISKDLGECIANGEETFWKLYAEDVEDPKYQWAKKSHLNNEADGFSLDIWSKPSPSGLHVSRAVV